MVSVKIDIGLGTKYYKYRCPHCAKAGKPATHWYKWRGRTFRQYCEAAERDVTMRLVPGQPEPVVVYLFTVLSVLNGVPWAVGPSLVHEHAKRLHAKYVRTGCVCSPLQRIVLDPPRKRSKA